MGLGTPPYKNLPATNTTAGTSSVVKLWPYPLQGIDTGQADFYIVIFFVIPIKSFHIEVCCFIQFSSDQIFHS